MRGMSPPTELLDIAKRENSRATSEDAHSGHATRVRPSAETSSSNRCAHELQVYS